MSSALPQCATCSHHTCNANPGLFTRSNSSTPPTFAFMPLRFAYKVAGDALLALWDAREPESWFLQRLRPSPGEEAELATIHPNRHIDWLATRYLLWLLSGLPERPPIVKDVFGRPSLEGSSQRVSISHSHGLAAVILSARAAGIDVQRWDNRIEHVAPRFLSPEELATLDGAYPREKAHLYWGAKEALYKAHGWKRLNFKQHLHCNPVEYRERGGHLDGYISVAPEARKLYRMHYRPFEEAMLVWVIDSGS